MRISALLLFLAACGNQFEATYDPAGSWSYAEMRGDDSSCPAELLTALEQGLEVAGSFPAFGSADVVPGTITILGTEIPIEIEAATDQDTAKGRPTDADATYSHSGVDWSLEHLSFESAAQCGACSDQIVVRLLTADATCNPWPVYGK